MRAAILATVICLAIGTVSTAGAEGAASLRQAISIGQQGLGTALQTLAKVRDVQVVYFSGEVNPHTTKGASGDLTLDETLTRLLNGTGLTYRLLDEKTVTIFPIGGAGPAGNSIGNADTKTTATGNFLLTRVAQASQSQGTQTSGSTSETVEENPDTKGIPEMLVKGSRGSSADIRRTNDDVQPYIVFDADQIENSMALSLDEFLRQQVPMNQSLTPLDDGGVSTQGNRSEINLRGLGVEETLILVNGRRQPGVANDSSGGGVTQTDINGIPLSAIERIEILPSTAGGIYGGGATGGVVNIILKRDYSNRTVTARYDGTVEGGGANRRLDIHAGFPLGERTRVTLTGSLSDGQPLYVGDRDFARRSREMMFRNDPGAFVREDPSAFVFAPAIVGYTTNIRNLVDAPLILKGSTPVSLGSRIAHVREGSAGYAVDGIFAFDRGYNLDLANAPLGNRDSSRSVPELRSLRASVEHDLNDRISFSLDVLSNQNNSIRNGTFGLGRAASNVTLLATDAANPFTTDVQITVPLVGFDTRRLEMPIDVVTNQVTAGMRFSLTRDWMAQADYTVGESTYEVTLQNTTALLPTATTALRTGTLNGLRDVNVYPLNFAPYYPPSESAQGGFLQIGYPEEMNTAALRVSGPLLSMPGGKLRLATLLERHEEFTGDRITTYSFPSATTPGATDPYYQYLAEVGSIAYSGYAELTAPLFSRQNAHPGINSLDLVASYRYDRTETRSTTVDNIQARVPSPDGPFPDLPSEKATVTADQFTLGFRYAPVESVALRASFGRGVLPPSPSQIRVNDVTELLSIDPDLVDPRRGGRRVVAQQVPVAVYSITGNLFLRPETSESISAGVIFRPAAIPGFRLSVDYTHLKKTDEITQINNEQLLLNNESSFRGVVERAPLTDADRALGFTGGEITAFRPGFVNVARMKMEAFDVQATYDWDTRFGSFSANLNGSVQPVLLQQILPGAATTDTVGYRNGPARVRATAGLRWSRGNLDLGWNTQYHDAYRVYDSTDSPVEQATDILGFGSSQVPSQTYHDVTARYRIGATQFAGGMLTNTSLRIGVLNVFDTRPHTLPSIAPQGQGTLFARGGDAKLQRYSLSIEKTF